MLTEKDLLALNEAARLILSVVERQRIHNEDANERRALFRIVNGDANGQKKTPDVVGTPGENVGYVEFTEKEIFYMPKQFKTKYRIDKKIVRCRKRPSGANGFTYELRYRCDGYNISASGKTLEKAKANFIAKMKTAQRKNAIYDVPTTFSAFAMYYFENFRKKKVTERTYKTDLNRLRLHLLPHFQEMPLSKIRPMHCQVIIEKLTDEGKTKTADELYGLLSVIFKAAIAHNIIQRSPLVLVASVQHETTHGVALSRSEEKTMLDALDGTPYRSAFALALYTGLRPNEYVTAKIDGPFVIAVNSKRKTKKTEYKRIPICKRLAAELAAQPLHFPCLRYMRDHIRNVLTGHKLYDLRTTFYSRCDELGVATAARDEFVGHSSGVLTNTYRDLSDNYLLKEGEKLNLW